MRTRSDANSISSTTSSGFSVLSWVSMTHKRDFPAAIKRTSIHPRNLTCTIATFLVYLPPMPAADPRKFLGPWRGSRVLRHPQRILQGCARRSTGPCLFMLLIMFRHHRHHHHRHHYHHYTISRGIETSGSALCTAASRNICPCTW